MIAQGVAVEARYCSPAAAGMELARFRVKTNIIDCRHAGESLHPDPQKQIYPAGYRLSPV
jgi:hypothetical protein